MVSSFFPQHDEQLNICIMRKPNIRTHAAPAARRQRAPPPQRLSCCSPGWTAVSRRLPPPASVAHFAAVPAVPRGSGWLSTRQGCVCARRGWRKVLEGMAAPTAWRQVRIHAWAASTCSAHRCRHSCAFLAGLLHISAEGHVDCIARALLIAGRPGLHLRQSSVCMMCCDLSLLPSLWATFAARRIAL